MKKQEREELRSRLVRRLRRQGVWDEKTPLPDDVIDRWANAAWLDGAGSQQMPPAILAADLLSWWDAALPGLRQYVLAGVAPETQHANATSDVSALDSPSWWPSWWPVYEQYVSDLVRPLVKGWLRDGTLDTVETVAARLGPILGFDVWSLDVAGFVNAIDDPKARIHIAPVRFGINYGIMTTVTINVSSPFIDPQVVAAAYERTARRIVKDRSDGPPRVASDSARFYLEYDAMVRSGLRSKPERLDRLSPELRGKRSANSAAAYHGKLKKAFLAAFDASTELSRLHRALDRLGRNRKETYNG